MTLASMTIGDFMTPVPATVHEGLSLADAQDRMYADNLRHLPVVGDAGTLMGVISLRDIMVATATSGRETKDIKVSEAMSASPFSCGRHAKLDAVAKEMEAHRYGSAVVVDDAKPVGVFTTTDALWALRQIVAGKPLEREVKPTHITDASGERPNVPHPHMPSSAANPTPNQGKFRP
jgi:acetoin utilization protein AcuB